MTRRRIRALAAGHYIARLEAELVTLRAERVSLAPRGGDYLARTTRPMLSGGEMLVTIGVFLACAVALVAWLA